MKTTASIFLLICMHVKKLHSNCVWCCNRDQEILSLMIKSLLCKYTVLLYLLCNSPTCFATVKSKAHTQKKDETTSRSFSKSPTELTELKIYLFLYVKHKCSNLIVLNLENLEQKVYHKKPSQKCLLYKHRVKAELIIS